MSALRQLALLTTMALQSLPERIGTSLVVVVGTAGVVAVLLSAMAIATGLGRAMENSGRADRVVILRGGSAAELGSSLQIDAVRAIADTAKGLRRDAQGEPLISPETMSMVTVIEKGSGDEVSVMLRGVEPKFTQVRPELKIIEGRLFTPGVSEVIVGRRARAQFEDLGLGSRLPMYGKLWEVVGIFESRGDPRESEIMTDAATIMSATGGRAYQSVTAVLDDVRSYDTLKDSLTTSAQLAVSVYSERARSPPCAPWASARSPSSGPSCSKPCSSRAQVA